MTDLNKYREGSLPFTARNGAVDALSSEDALQLVYRKRGRKRVANCTSTFLIAQDWNGVAYTALAWGEGYRYRTTQREG